MTVWSQQCVFQWFYNEVTKLYNLYLQSVKLVLIFSSYHFLNMYFYQSNTYIRLVSKSWSLDLKSTSAWFYTMLLSSFISKFMMMTKKPSDLIWVITIWKSSSFHLWATWSKQGTLCFNVWIYKIRININLSQNGWKDEIKHMKEWQLAPKIAFVCFKGMTIIYINCLNTLCPP